MKCAMCKGEKVIWIPMGGWDPDPDPVLCPECKGEDPPCDECFGVGILLMGSRYPYEEVTCSHCGGSGRCQ